jgi:hypothetical protein
MASFLALLTLPAGAYSKFTDAPTPHSGRGKTEEGFVKVSFVALLNIT